jgi:hypothetical protein
MKRLPMRKIRDALRLRANGLSMREIAASLGVGQSCGWARAHDPGRLEAACQRALEIGARSYTSVNSILKARLDRRRPEPAADRPAISHPNIRGGDYFR